jgi:hypothetical protein
MASGQPRCGSFVEKSADDWRYSKHLIPIVMACKRKVIAGLRSLQANGNATVMRIEILEMRIAEGSG